MSVLTKTFFSRFRHEDNIVGVEHCMQGHCVLEERTIWSNVVMCQMPFQGRGRPHVAFDSSLALQVYQHVEDRTIKNLGPSYVLVDEVIFRGWLPNNYAKAVKNPLTTG
ncbi:hypothetical protein M514_23534 [Trichuris suis]|uniref:Uncharacterized protein n=1 Tax=Trichuris suis TaxID=68888 RepID=A0A085N454_9BILA|nr:hypothetical protein M514_23534 [Trichuris suis]